MQFQQIYAIWISINPLLPPLIIFILKPLVFYITLWSVQDFFETKWSDFINFLVTLTLSMVYVVVVFESVQYLSANFYHEGQIF